VVSVLLPLFLVSETVSSLGAFFQVNPIIFISQVQAPACKFTCFPASANVQILT
jgi:hypothetical protein